jgi:hypothetical protein
MKSRNKNINPSETQNDAVFFGKSPTSKPFFQKNAIQAKLEVNQPGDKYEKEADTVADNAVQRLSENNHSTKKLNNPVQAGSSNISFLQKKCASCETGEDTETVQREGGDDSIAPASVENRLSGSKGTGSSLPEQVNNSMSQAIGADFSNVNIHTGSNAVQLSKDLNAQAFTHGNDIYFNEGKYNPESKDGQHLLAHELTHTVQQNSISPLQSSVQRQEDMSFSLAEIDLEEARTREETETERSRRLNVVTVFQRTIQMLSVAIRRHFLVQSNIANRDIEFEFEINNRIFTGARETPAHPATLQPQTEGESWEERNIRLQNLIQQLQELNSILISQPAPENWYQQDDVIGGRDPVWVDAATFYERYAMDSDLWVANVFYIQNISLRPVVTSEPVHSMPTGIYIIVPDPLNNPYEYSIVTREHLPSNGVIYDVMHEGENYFYLYQGRRIYLPDPPGHETPPPAQDQLMQGILQQVDSSKEPPVVQRKETDNTLPQQDCVGHTNRKASQKNN